MYLAAAYSRASAIIKPIRRQLALSVLVLASASAIEAREKPLTSVADLRYGAALYNYYLDDYLSAMSELLIADEQGGIAGHGENPKIMEGGLAAGYGMERYASDIFERLLDQNRSQSVRDSAWYFLAKLRYQHEDWARAAEALDKVGKKPEKKLAEDINALRMNILLKQDKPAEAAEYLKKNRFAERWLPYFHFNIGTAFARKRQFADAIDYFDFLAQDIYQGEEYRTLYDKAMTASGYAYLFEQRYEEAKAQFSRVRLNSKLSNRALLGYGWAAAELEQYQEALKPWLHLTRSSVEDENHQEAMIAVPYAYEKMGELGLALNHYQKAEASFSEEIQKIDQVLISLQNDDLLDALQLQSEGDIDWLSFARDQQLSPRLTYLIQLFSRNDFQGSVIEFRDLLALRTHLNEWQTRLTFYSEMIAARELDRTEKSEFLKVSALTERIAAMQQQRSDYAKEIERIASEKDFFSLAAGDEVDLISRVSRSGDTIEKLRESDPFIDEYEESNRRYRGLLLWDANEKFGERLWKAIKTLNKLDDTITELSDVKKRINALMLGAPDLDRYRGQVDTANTQLESMLAKIEEAISNNEGELKAQVIAVLYEQRRRLSNYLAQSRLSVARIYDLTNQERENAEFQRIKDQAQVKQPDDTIAEGESEIETETETEAEEQ